MQTETIVITGASRGIGEETAYRLAGKGRRMLLLARSEDDLVRVRRRARRRGARVDYLTVDLADRSQVERVLDAIDQEWAPVDTLVLNAGTANGRPFLESDSEGTDYEFEVNLFAPAVFLRRLLGPMVERGSGRVAVVGSLTAVLPFPGNATYAGSKAALQALVRSIRLELADSEVHVGLILPGFTRTMMTSRLSSLLPSKSPEAVARAIERSLDERRALVVPGLLNKLAMRAWGFAPDLADTLLARLPGLVPRPMPEGVEPIVEPSPGGEASPWPRAS